MAWGRAPPVLSDEVQMHSWIQAVGTEPEEILLTVKDEGAEAG